MKNGHYILVLAPKDFPGKRYRGLYCYEHTLVWWKNTGNIPSKGEVVHHKNHNRTDNQIGNLKLLKIKTHNSIHNSERKKEIEILCSSCGKIIKISEKKYLFKKKMGYENIYCNRVCMGTKQGKDNNLGRLRRKKY